VLLRLQESRVPLGGSPELRSSPPTPYKPFRHLGRLSADAIATAAFFAESHGLPVILCGKPELPFREELVNALTVLQLKAIFTRCARLLALYPDVLPHTPFTMACRLYPQLFLGQEDKYITTVLEYLVARAEKSQRIFCLLGNF